MTTGFRPRAAVAIEIHDDPAPASACHRGKGGSFLFWEPANEDRIPVSMNVSDAPTGGHLVRPIIVDDNGDYHDISDGMLQSD